MQTHVKVLAVLFIVFSALGVLSAIALLAVFGASAGIVGATAEPGDAALAESDMRIPERDHLRVRQRRDIRVSHPHRSLVGRVQPPEYVQQRALAHA